MVGKGLRADGATCLGYEPSRDAVHGLFLGHDARVRSGTVLYRGTVIGQGLQTGHNVVIREECQIGDDVCVWSNSVIDYGCRLGDRVKIHCNCYVAQYTDIEDDAFLAPGVTIANDIYPGQTSSASRMRGPSIGAGAQLGVNVTVLPYVRIGEESLIGAGSVVTKDIPPGVVVVGNPARVTGEVGALRPVELRREVTARRRESGIPTNRSPLLSDPVPERQQ